MKKVIYLSIMFLMISLTMSAQASGGQITRKKANTTTTQPHNSDKKTQNAQSRLAQQRRTAQLQAERERRDREELEQAEKAHRNQFRQQEDARKKEAEEQRVKEELSNRRESFYKQEYVDLGLPSGTLWATRNVGAYLPEQDGEYFAWGETISNKDGKFDYSPKKYKWAKKYKDIKYNDIDNKKELDLEDDAAFVKLGSQWRIPSLEQIKELINCCTWTWTVYNNVNGYMIKGKNGYTIFLPVNGTFYGKEFGKSNIIGTYWSRTCASHCAYYLYFNNSGMIDFVNHGRYFGQTIRPIYVKNNSQ